MNRPVALVFLSTVIVLADGGCTRECADDGDCKGDRVCESDGLCHYPTIYTCSENTVVATNGPDEVERVDCSEFLSSCLPKDGIDWCVRPDAAAACRHVYEDCGLAFNATDGGSISEAECASIMQADFGTCAIGCFGTSSCADTELNTCFDTPETCRGPPRAPNDEPDRQPNPSPDPGPDPEPTCCRVCHSGNACGDSCISASSTCHQPPGCACNG